VVGIIGAMKVEVEYIIEKIEEKTTEILSEILFTKGRLSGSEVVVAACSPGKVNAAIAAQAMIFKYSPNVIINTGCAGSLTKDVYIGSMVVASGAVQYDVDTSALGDPKGYISGVNRITLPCDKDLANQILKTASDRNIKHVSGIIATGDKFLCDNAEKEMIAEKYKAIAVDMETAAIAQVCYVNHVPFTALRCISDNADDESNLDYNIFVSIAAKNAAILVTDFISGSGYQ
jgi:adenosylhomocysteine nucleosidase